MTDKYNPTLLALLLRECATLLAGRLPRDPQSKAEMLRVLNDIHKVADDLSPQFTSTMFVDGRNEVTPMHRWWQQVADEFNDVGKEWMPEGQSCVRLLGVSTKLQGDSWFVYFEMEVTLLEQREGDPLVDKIEHLFFRDGPCCGTLVPSPMTKETP